MLQQSVFTHMASIYANVLEQKKAFAFKKRVQLPQDWFGTPTWPPFYCFGTPIWPPWRNVKTPYILPSVVVFFVVLRATKGVHNTNLQVSITNACHMRMQPAFVWTSFKMNGINRTQSVEARLDLLSLDTFAKHSVGQRKRVCVYLALGP